MHGNSGGFALSSAINTIASTLNNNSCSTITLWPSPPSRNGWLTLGKTTIRLALSDIALPMPQPGEIWQLCRSVQSPIPLSEEDQRSHYPEAVLRFLNGETPPRYVMVVTEPDLSDDDWPVVSVMMLSVKPEGISEVDLVIPAEISGVGCDLLAETWHIQRALVCNLSNTVGHRLSRHLYDLLMSVGDRHYGLIDDAPTLAELQAAGLQVGTRSANDPQIQHLHQQERDWGSLLSLPVAACRAFRKSMQHTSRILEEALLISREMALDPADYNSFSDSPTPPADAE